MASASSRGSEGAALGEGRWEEQRVETEPRDGTARREKHGRKKDGMAGAWLDDGSCFNDATRRQPVTPRAPLSPLCSIDKWPGCWPAHVVWEASLSGARTAQTGRQAAFGAYPVPSKTLLLFFIRRGGGGHEELPLRSMSCRLGCSWRRTSCGARMGYPTLACCPFCGLRGLDCMPYIADWMTPLAGPGKVDLQQTSRVSLPPPPPPPPPAPPPVPAHPAKNPPQHRADITGLTTSRLLSSRPLSVCQGLTLWPSSLARTLRRPKKTLFSREVRTLAVGFGSMGAIRALTARPAVVRL